LPENEKPILGNRLAGSVRAIEPAFKVLLFPYLVGEALPKAGLSRNELTVIWDDQVDSITFEAPESEPTGITVKQKLEERSSPKPEVVPGEALEP
jgi:hypothetical protein